MPQISWKKITLIGLLVVCAGIIRYSFPDNNGPIGSHEERIAVARAWSRFGLYGPVVEGIYLMRIDGTGLTPLVQQEYVTQPAWSPQGSKIAYDGPGGLYVVNADGSGQPELLWPGSVTLSPTWSPEASKIAFEDNWSIQILDLTTQKTRQLLDQSLAASDPDWAPGGNKIALTLRPGFGRDRGPDDSIGVINVDGSGLIQLTPNDGSRFPKWSPDGRKILFVREGDVYIMNADGTDPKALTNDGLNRAPTWSPDGTRIAFVSYKNAKCGPTFADSLPFCTSELRLMDADGSNVVVVRSKPRENIGWPAWAPSR